MLYEHHAQCRYSHLLMWLQRGVTRSRSSASKQLHTRATVPTVRGRSGATRMTLTRDRRGGGSSPAAGDSAAGGARASAALLACARRRGGLAATDQQRPTAASCCEAARHNPTTLLQVKSIDRRRAPQRRRPGLSLHALAGGSIPPSALLSALPLLAAAAVTVAVALAAAAAGAYRCRSRRYAHRRGAAGSTSGELACSEPPVAGRSDSGSDGAAGSAAAASCPASAAACIRRHTAPLHCPNFGTVQGLKAPAARPRSKVFTRGLLHD